MSRTVADILADIDQAQSRLVGLLAELRNLPPANLQARPDPLAPRLDRDRLAITFAGKVCEVRSRQLFELFARLARRPGWYVTVVDIELAAWGETEGVSPDAVRQAVRRLRQKLEAAGMEDLAAAIDGRSVPGAYRVVPVWQKDVTDISQAGPYRVTG